jgi:hypothetical protein
MASGKTSFDIDSPISKGSESNSKKLKKLPASEGTLSSSSSSPLTRGWSLVRFFDGSFQLISVGCHHNLRFHNPFSKLVPHTTFFTSRSHENASMASVMPSSAGVSLFSGCGTYLNSFFNTESEKKGFSLKYCAVISVNIYD